jgi:hypothetical protein
MALIEFIEYLQQKPESVRRRIMAVSVAGIMGTIVFLWILTLQYTLNAKPARQANQPAATDASPFALLGESIMQNVTELGKKLFTK